jgi:hypothetical protein
MLVDVTFKRPDPQMAMILGIIGGEDIVPRRIAEGMYQCGHWSIDQFGLPLKDRWGDNSSLGYAVDTYGVCDYPEQVVERFPILKTHPGKFFISFVRIRRGEQPRDGGWRWHKWGTYIGEKSPQCEYLHDEPEIEEVYTFSIYEVE